MNGLGRRDAGAALILVLFVALLIGAVALALTFTVTLDALAARHAQEAALAEGEAEGALALGVALVHHQAGGPIDLAAVVSRCRGLGWSATVALVPVGSGAVRLDVAARAGRAAVRRSATLRTDAAVMTLIVRP